MHIFSLEDAVINTLLAGQYYADVFAKLVELAAKIQDHQASNLDSTPVVAQLRTVAEEGRAELALQLDQIREFLTTFASRTAGHTGQEDGIEACATEPSKTTKH
jgi:site-specific recombinase XerC